MADMEILTIPLTDAMKQSGATGMLIPEDTIYDGNIDQALLVSASQETVLGNDTIYSIAARTNSDWKQIVSINNLEYPYVSANYLDALSPATAATSAPKVPTGTLELVIPGITPKQDDILAFDSGRICLTVKSFDGYTIALATPAPGGIPTGGVLTLHEKKMLVAVPGQKLSIPGDSPSIGQISSSTETFEEMLFGIDEFLDNDGQMHADQSDIVSIGGMQNLAMQIYHRINTLKGELSQLGHPEYGSLVPTFVGKPMTPVWQERILLECRLAAEADPRVQYLDNVRLYNEGTALFFEADVFPINNQDPVVVSIPLM